MNQIHTITITPIQKFFLRIENLYVEFISTHFTIVQILNEVFLGSPSSLFVSPTYSFCNNRYKTVDNFDSLPMYPIVIW